MCLTGNQSEQATRRRPYERIRLRHTTELFVIAGEGGEPESFINEIGWDIYVSTRASANSPDAIHGKFEGPGA